jgi:hypothetical protein
LIRVGLIIHEAIVFTTSHHANIAHEASKIPAIIIAQVILIAFAQTAGPILFAISLAQIFIAIYNHKIVATNKYIFDFNHK